MAEPTPKRRSETAEKILDVAEHLLQTRGYSAISYQDVADAIKIRKASIHYHFPSKADLGLAVIERYTARFDAALAQLEADEAQPTAAILERYFEPFTAFAESPDYVCLCGALAGELPALPPEMRARVERFFVFHQDWLARILERGLRRGDISLAAPTGKFARTMFGALQGALLIKRATGNAGQVFDVIDVLTAQLGQPAPLPSDR